MDNQTAAPMAPAGLARHPFTFEGRAGEYFKIWIVNLVLSILTLGIFSAWAKVRTKRYFYGSTHVAGHSFEYHASPIRILIGRLIAAGLLLAYSLSGLLSPFAALAWIFVLLFAAPWLITSSLRFNARNSSYRNVRFHFTASYWQAFKVILLWPIFAIITLYTTAPLAHRAHSYFYINNHTYGGKPFGTEFPGGKIYYIYAICLLPIIVLGITVFAFAMPLFGAIPRNDPAAAAATFSALLPILGVLYVAFIAAIVALQVLSFNLAINNMKLAERHEFRSTMSVLPVIGISISNFVAILCTLGLAYPWARIRMARYQFEHLELLAASDLGEFSTAAAADQNAITEEISGFFDLDFGL